MHSSPAPKVFIRRTINAFVLYLEGGLESNQNRTETRDKVSIRLLSVKDGTEKRQKQGRDERTQKKTQHLMCIFADVG